MNYSDIRENRIPHARSVLYEIADELREDGDADHANQIEDVIAGLLFRRATGKPAKARKTARKITGEVVRDVLEYYAAHPSMHIRDIGRAFGIDGGRVSEIINGLRTVEHPTIQRGDHHA